MSHEMELPAFERPQRNGHDGHAANDLGRLSDVPVELAVEIGRTRMTVGETLELRPGSIVVLNRMAGEPVDLLVNGTPIAHGEVVVIDEEFGLRITDVIGGGAAGASTRDDAPEPAQEPAAEAPGTV
ncbi:flagellar motor switch protein FliN [Conexibacter arvalis]|uniref:Flagellar motor switch protein FliN/FliY n=1 Tax=Conexibacter arvalis TaxID=912552 RepID=A0A840I800_9ACTN|nr:flagellar motor switch protein FliN [Conexibacter arvalis]MBB4660996.1 flagellar motor switch protein FliN/FliY [Conexibacter arvalis]